MPSPAAKFVSAVFAGVLASIPLASTSHGAAAATDDCLSGPKDQAIQGSHWHYRIDHATKRHCWYLKDEHEKLSQAASPGSSGSVQPMASKAAMPRSTADAHAELPAQATIEQPKRSVGPAPAISADTTVAAPSAETSRSVVASRWLDQPDTSSSTNPAPAAGNSDAAAPPFGGGDAVGRGCRGTPRRRGLIGRKTVRLNFRRCCWSSLEHQRWQA